MFLANVSSLLSPLLVVVTWCGLYRSFRRLGDSRVLAIAEASVAWGVIVWGVAEILNLSARLTPMAARMAWAVAAAISCLLPRILRRWSLTPMPTASSIASRMPPGDRLLMTATLCIVLLCSLVAFHTPIIAWDALHYHLPRVFYWAQNASIEHYPTANARQLFMGPWPAFAQLHLFLLLGSDRLAHAVQLLGFVGCLVFGCATTRLLGATSRAVPACAALMVSLPMAVLQASTALVDLVVAFWLLLLVYLGLESIQRDAVPRRLSVALGAALGLAMLTKSTVLPMILPFITGWVAFRWRPRLSSTARTVVVAGLVALALNVPHWMRNQEAFGSPFGPEDHRRMVLNEAFSPSLVVSNLLRQGLVHLGTADPQHSGIQKGVSNRIHAMLGIDDGDSRNSYYGQDLRIEPLRRNENVAGNPLHLLVFLACALLLPFHVSGRSRVSTTSYFLCLFAAVVLFTAMFKYQHSISRLQLPLFMLAVPWATAVLSALHRLRTLKAVAWLALAGVLPCVLYAEQRPLLGERSVLTSPRESFLYQNGPQYRMPAQAVARIIERSRSPRLGLMTEGASLEYYLWYELGVNRGGAPYIVNLAPPPGFDAMPDVPPSPSSAPRWVVWLEGPSAPPMGLVIEGSSYERKRYWRWGHDALYRKKALRDRSVDTRSESG